VVNDGGEMRLPLFVSFGGNVLENALSKFAREWSFLQTWQFLLQLNAINGTAHEYSVVQ
jgi:hypothetical protein